MATRFVDEATIDVRSGDGGRGAVSFRREKFAPLGGPDGGDGGKGGDVILHAAPSAKTLLDYRYKTHYRAEAGLPGAGSRCYGRAGHDLTLQVPPGTQVFEGTDESGPLLVDLAAPGQSFVIAKGGRGGRGNAHFATPTRQAPDFAQPGEPGEARALCLVLKLLADVALVGLPNAGKSTLIRRISASRARVADYPFTTLVPNLGVVRHRDRTFTVADIPGLIEGAHDGAGLGLRFLRHVERCRVLVHLVGVDLEPPPAEAYAVIRRELELFDPELARRPEIVVLNKADLLGDQSVRAGEVLCEAIGRPVRVLSGVSGAGVTALLDDLLPFVNTRANSDGWQPPL